MSNASEITRLAKSNLAFALKILPRDRREEMVVFYAFCRTMDDLADDPDVPTGDRVASLDLWAKGIVHGFHAPDALQRDLILLRDRRQIPNELLVAIIDGCRMDLNPQRFATWADLSEYIWKVACAVGLVSIRIFGCQDPGSEKYAVALGHALQLTNILRDIAEDQTNGRLYLPLEDLARFGCKAESLTSPGFQALMSYEAERAGNYFRAAADLIPAADRHALVPARIMAEIYQIILGKMRADGFQVFKKRYRISKARKLAILSKHLIARSRRVE